MSVTDVAAYAFVAALAIAAPGADFAVVFKHAVTTGRAAGVRAAVGVAGGFAVHALAAGLGIGAVLLASATAFTVVKLLGALYLVFLGLRALHAALRRRPPADVGAAAGGRGRPLREALLVNALNPKVVLTYLALMPQFLPPGAGPADTLVLSAATVLIALAWFVVVALTVSSLRRVLLRERVRRMIDGVTGAVLVALGARLAASSR
jgi:threonine/homoserine/homoserine lactone efflux protein